MFVEMPFSKEDNGSQEDVWLMPVGLSDLSANDVEAASGSIEPASWVTWRKNWTQFNYSVLITLISTKMTCIAKQYLIK